MIKGKWHEKDISTSKNKGFNFNNGILSMGNETFQGKSINKSFAIGLGVDKNTNETGIITASFDTNKIKELIRAYLKSCGLKKLVS